jgi:hypothetical protein
MPKWEYEQLTPARTEDPMEAARRLGAEGWEWFAIRPANGFVVECWFFKRAVPDCGSGEETNEVPLPEEMRSNARKVGAKR